jgi:hypothetical protein
MQLYVIKFVGDLRQVGGFFPGTHVSFTNETGRNNITEMLLKVALNMITLNLQTFYAKRVTCNNVHFRLFSPSVIHRTDYICRVDR